MIAAILAMLIGVASAIFHLFQRKRLDAALVVLAAAGLAGIIGNFSMPGTAAGPVSIASDDVAPVVGDASAIKLSGDGLRASQWHDLPARPLQWTPPAGDFLRLDFPRVADVGRMFRLTAAMPQAASRRLQLLAENGQVIAEAAGTGAALSVQWLPPAAETLLLKARLLNSAGKIIAEGPVPLEVHESVPLQVQGRFGSPSFDAGALNTLLANSNAVLDWQVKLGKTVTRNETARAAMAKPDLLVADAGYVERLSDSARGAMLAQVAAGTPLLVLAYSANEPKFWSRALQLELKDQGESKAGGAPLELMPAPYNPAAKVAAPWSASGERVWTRNWEKGRIVWLGVSEWHRYAISQPQALGVWWQDVLDRAGVRRAQEVALLDPEEMPLPGQRLEVCAQGVAGNVTFPGLKQTLAWQRRPDKADASCVAVWPEAAGWLRMHDAAKPAQASQLYVFAKEDWPLWQKAQRRDATLRYAARTPVQPGKNTQPLPAWPFALLFAASMLLLWWRERR